MWHFLYKIGSCFLDTGYVYNTEAHPIDIGSLDCCTSSFVDENSSDKIQENLLVKIKFKKKEFFFYYCSRAKIRWNGWEIHY